MFKALKLACAVLALVVAPVPTTLAAQSNAESPDVSDVLKGLKGFDVFVNLKSQTLDSAAVRTKVELKLRQNGIAVGHSYSPFMSVGCVALDKSDDANLIAYTCNIQILLKATLANPPQLTRYISAWESKQWVATVGRAKFASTVEGDVNDLLDEFLNSWYTANPKRP